MLKGVSLTGVTLAAPSLPRLALDIPAGKVLAKLAPLSALVLIGQEWSAKGSQRLYGTLIEPGNATFMLGYVDLKFGEIHAAVDGKLAKDLGAAAKSCNCSSNDDRPYGR